MQTIQITTMATRFLLLLKCAKHARRSSPAATTIWLSYSNTCALERKNLPEPVVRSSRLPRAGQKTHQLKKPVRFPPSSINQSPASHPPNPESLSDDTSSTSAHSVRRARHDRHRTANCSRHDAYKTLPAPTAR